MNNTKNQVTTLDKEHVNYVKLRKDSSPFFNLWHLHYEGIEEMPKMFRFLVTYFDYGRNYLYHEIVRDLDRSDRSLLDVFDYLASNYKKGMSSLDLALLFREYYGTKKSYYLSNFYLERAEFYFELANESMPDWQYNQGIQSRGRGLLDSYPNTYKKVFLKFLNKYLNSDQRFAKIRHYSGFDGSQIAFLTEKDNAILSETSKNNILKLHAEKGKPCDSNSKSEIEEAIENKNFLGESTDMLVLEGWCNRFFQLEKGEYVNVEALESAAKTFESLMEKCTREENKEVLKRYAIKCLEFAVARLKRDQDDYNDHLRRKEAMYGYKY